MDEAKTVLDGLMAHEALQSVPLLCMANKQDLEAALALEDLSRIFDLEEKQGSRPVHIHPCSAFRGQGLEEGVRWLMAEAARFSRSQVALARQNRKDKEDEEDEDSAG